MFLLQRCSWTVQSVSVVDLLEFWDEIIDLIPQNYSVKLHALDDPQFNNLSISILLSLY